uniref:Phospholipid scramblase n=1 Tax=Erpetoichthys calabaricus TaxID=27687 RepID=A0A8C4SW64_ERPCA
MPAPSRPIGCPPGLEYLTQIDQVLIHQQIELAEVIFGLQFNNKYEIKNSLGQKIFFAAEENDFCNRCCCGPLRSFCILHLGCEVVLSLLKTCSKIQGPCCGCRCCADVNFKVLSLDGNSEVGMITKQWGGILREAYTNADNFGVQFPMDLDVKVKAVMLGACFLIVSSNCYVIPQFF